MARTVGQDLVTDAHLRDRGWDEGNGPHWDPASGTLRYPGFGDLAGREGADGRVRYVVVTDHDVPTAWPDLDAVGTAVLGTANLLQPVVPQDERSRAMREMVRSYFAGHGLGTVEAYGPHALGGLYGLYGLYEAKVHFSQDGAVSRVNVGLTGVVC